MFGDAWNQISKHHFLNSSFTFFCRGKSLYFFFFINVFSILFFPPLYRYFYLFTPRSFRSSLFSYTFFRIFLWKKKKMTLLNSIFPKISKERSTSATLFFLEPISRGNRCPSNYPTSEEKRKKEGTPIAEQGCVHKFHALFILDFPWERAIFPSPLSHPSRDPSTSRGNGTVPLLQLASRISNQTSDANVHDYFHDVVSHYRRINNRVPFIYNRCTCRRRSNWSKRTIV